MSQLLHLVLTQRKSFSDAGGKKKLAVQELLGGLDCIEDSSVCVSTLSATFDVEEITRDTCTIKDKGVLESL